MALTEKQLSMEISKGNILQFLDGQEKKLMFGWVTGDAGFTDVEFDIQVIDEFGDPVLIDGITWEGTITLGQVQDVVAESLDEFREKAITGLKKPSSKMIYGMEMNLHQVDRHTIMMYVFGTTGKDRTPVKVEHPDKHPQRTKKGGEPYASEHGHLFNVLKVQLVKEGKWID